MIIQIQNNCQNQEYNQQNNPLQPIHRPQQKKKTFSHTTLLTPAKKFQRNKHQERSTYMLTWAYDTDFPVASLTGTDHIF